MEDQKKVWDKIAPEWAKYKKPGEKTLDFMENQEGKVLDMGCGSGRYMIKKKNQEYYGIDFSREMIKLAKKKAKILGINAELKVAGVDKIPYPDNFFDSALYDSSLHCIHSKIKRKNSLKELFRVLKPEGIAKINVWNKEAKRFRNKKKKDTVKWTTKGPRSYYFYDPKELYKEIEDAGFKILIKKEPTLAIVVRIQKPKN